MRRNRNILVVENEAQERAAFGRMLEGWGYAATLVAGREEAAAKAKSVDFSLIIASYDIHGADSQSLLDLGGRDDERPRVLFVSRGASVEAAVAMMKAGAYDFILKPVENEQLFRLVQRIFSESPGTAPAGGARNRGGTRIVVQDQSMLKVLELARQVADSRASVLIQGDSGTGKELLARFIHENSRRRQAPFVAVNCAALPETLLESELFGHEKGAFTGAVAAKPGKFELACGGTLLLDEITEMPLHLQSKLLRVLQEREIDRVGGRHPIPVDIRVIATTNRDMKETLQKKEFREDLYYRLNVIPIRIPSLRERPGDIPALARYFMMKYNELDGRNVKEMTEPAIRKLMPLTFNGNVRELENIIERAVLLCDGVSIRPQDLYCDDVMVSPGEAALTDGESIPEAFAPRQLKDVEKNLIFQTLDQTNGNRTHAAKILGISIRTLRNKLNEYREFVED